MRGVSKKADCNKQSAPKHISVVFCKILLYNERSKYGGC